MVAVRVDDDKAGSPSRRPGGRRSGPARAIVLTARDQKLARWVTRHGVVTAAQICRRFFGSMSVTWRRVLKLERLGLVRRDSAWLGMPRLIRTTAAGARLADVDLGPAPFDIVRLRHQLAVVDLAEELLLNSPRASWATERELRRDLAARRPRGVSVRHGRVPDGMLLVGSRRIAVELDLTPKRSRRLGLLIAAYARDREVDAVWWYLPSETAVQRLQDVVRARGLEHLVEARLRRVPRA